jgi:hypothetical protein
MRRRVLALAAAATPALMAACFGTGQVIVTVAAEGGVDATADVASESTASDGDAGGQDAVAEVGAATEAGGEAGTDAPAGDGGPDAAPTTVTVKLTVYLGPNPIPEPAVVVFFSGADGSLIAEAVSDANGQASATVPAGSMVTAAFGGPGNWWPTTVMGIQPGDVINMLDPQSGLFGPTVQSYSGDFTALPPAMLPDGGEVTTYTVSDPCGPSLLDTDGGLPGPFTNCNWGPLFPSLVLGGVLDDAGNSQTVSFAGSKALAAPTDGGELSISLDLSWQSPVTSTVTVIAGNINGATTTAVYDIVDNWSFAVPSLPSSGLDGGAVEQTFQNYPGFPEFVQAETDQDVTGTGSSYVIGAIGTKGGTIPPATTLDVSKFLPAILVGAVDSKTDPTRPVATWSPVGPLTSAIGTEAQLVNKQQTVYWSFFAPADTTRVEVPVLPLDLMTPPDGGADGGSDTDLALDMGSGPYSLYVQAVKFDAVKGYAEFRQTAGNLALVNVYNWGPAAPEPLPAAGTYYATYYQNLN